MPVSQQKKWVYRQDQEEPAFAVDWRDHDNQTIDFSTGYTFQVKLSKGVGTAATVTKTSGITGSATSPNVTIAWASGELNIDPGEYIVFIKAVSVAGDRRFMPGSEPTIVIEPTPA